MHRTESEIRVFGFDGGRNATAGRPFPYVRIAKMNVANSTLASELDIWNSAFAFATPALTTRPGAGNEQVAMSLAVSVGGCNVNFGDL